MHMLIGVLCEVVSVVAETERDDVAIQVLKKSILLELKRFDVNGNGKITKHELDDVLKSSTTLSALRSLDVDVECRYEFQQARYNDVEISIEDIMELLLSYRGHLTCTVKHFVDSQTFTRCPLCPHMKTQERHRQHFFKALQKSVAGSAFELACTRLFEATFVFAISAKAYLT